MTVVLWPAGASGRLHVCDLQAGSPQRPRLVRHGRLLAASWCGAPRPQCRSPRSLRQARLCQSGAAACCQRARRKGMSFLVCLTLWQDTGVQSRCFCSQSCTHCTGISGADKSGLSTSETCVLVQLPGPESWSEVGIIESYMCLYADVEAAAGQLLDAYRI